MSDYRESLCARLRYLGADEEEVEQIRILESVEASYLKDCMLSIERNYSGFFRFVRDVLLISPDMQKKLEEKYTCQANP